MSPITPTSPLASVSTAGLDMNEIFDLSPIPTLVLSSTYQIHRASQSLLEVWNVARDECEAHDLVSVLHTRGLLSAEDESHLIRGLDEAVSRRAVQTVQTTDSGKNISWSARIIPIFKASKLLSFFLEWEQLSNASGVHSAPKHVLPHGALSTDEAFSILVQAVKDYAILLLDTHGRIATWNTGAELHKGYKRDEIVGKHFSIFYGEDDLKAGKPEWELEVCRREGRVEDEGWRYRKDGTRFWANVIITAVYKNGIHVGYGKVTRDLTERRANHLRLINAYEESAKLKSDFLANMSHEIRTPMHGMLSACTLLLDTPLTREQQDMANIIGESGQVLLQVINDILDYSKLASGSFSITSNLVGVASIITSVVRSVQTTLRPTVHFELFLDQDLPKSAQGDPLRYRQIVQNIVGNAAKFTDRGTIAVSASLRSEDEDNYEVLTEVTDTGIGIPEAASRKLFKPFTQLDNTTKKRYQGTGLGLSICKSLAELMGGRIGFRPNPERQGSVFWFTARFKKIKNLNQIQPATMSTTEQQLPVHEHRGRSPPQFSPPASAGTRTPPPLKEKAVMADSVAELRELAAGKHILVVEDNIINQKVLLGMLRSLSFRDVAVASDGAQAVSMVRANPAAYDLVLMDINMPIVDGHEATAQIRESGITLPIIAMTAYALKGDMELCLEKGMDDYIPKPMEKKLLVKLLLKWLLPMGAAVVANAGDEGVSNNNNDGGGGGGINEKTEVGPPSGDGDDKAGVEHEEKVGVEA